MSEPATDWRAVCIAKLDAAAYGYEHDRAVFARAGDEASALFAIGMRDTLRQIARELRDGIAGGILELDPSKAAELPEVE